MKKFNKIFEFWQKLSFFQKIYIILILIFILSIPLITFYSFQLRGFKPRADYPATPPISIPVSITPPSNILTNWEYQTPLPIPINNHKVVSVNDFLFNLGGSNGINQLNVVYAAKINNGLISSWLKKATLPQPLTQFAAFSNNGYIYILGGYSQGAEYPYGYFYQINKDGSFGRGGLIEMPKPLAGLTAVVNKNHVYVIGGQNGYKTHSSVYFAKIKHDGYLESWVSTSPLPISLKNHSAVVYNGYIFVLGGISGSTVQSNIYSAKINMDGSLGIWNTLSKTPLPKKLANSVALLYKNYVFIIGGETEYGYSSQSDVYYSKINNDGTLAGWEKTVSLPKPLSTHAGTIFNNYIFITGGFNDQENQPRQNAVYSTQIIDNYFPSISPSPTPLPKRYIRILQPNGGETLYTQQSYLIKWEQKLIDKVSIGYKTCPSCLDWIVYNKPTSGERDSYLWLVPSRLAGFKNVKIYIIGYQTGVGSVSDESDGGFNILQSPKPSAPPQKTISPPIKISPTPIGKKPTGMPSLLPTRY